MYLKYKIFLITCLLLFKTVSLKLLYPAAENIAVNKPLIIQPTGSTCGLELKDTLCDNRLQDKCSNSTSLFYCDQSCPYGNVLENLNKLEQTKLEDMNPCVILKDFGYLLSNSTSRYSYLFDKNNNLCNNNARIVAWKPFSLETNQAKPSITFYNSRTSSLGIFNSGFTVSFWFQQFMWNNG